MPSTVPDQLQIVPNETSASATEATPIDLQADPIVFRAARHESINCALGLMSRLLGYIDSIDIKSLSASQAGALVSVCVGVYRGLASPAAKAGPVQGSLIPAPPPPPIPAAEWNARLEACNGNVTAATMLGKENPSSVPESS